MIITRLTLSNNGRSTNGTVVPPSVRDCTIPLPQWPSRSLKKKKKKKKKLIIKKKKKIKIKNVVNILKKKKKILIIITNITVKLSNVAYILKKEKRSYSKIKWST